MDLWAGLAIGFAEAISPLNLGYCLLGVLLGTLVGVLPGVAPAAAIAMLLPITHVLPASTSIIMLAGIYYGAQYGGSTTAILVNLPGEASSAVTALDGYAMARAGRAGTALATAALSSFVGGTVATVFVALAAPPMTALALSFGPAEYVALIVVGLVCSVALASGSTAKALAAIVFGLLLGLTGTDTTTGAQRFTLGVLEFADGLSFVALAMGVFGLSEVIRNLEAPETRSTLKTRLGGLFLGKDDARRIVGPTLRGTGVGSALGVLPGGGALIAAFLAYSLEKQIARNPEAFGGGAIEGVAAPEAANNAGAQTSFIPMLTLGIPGNPVMALMIGALIIQGITPGPNVMKTDPALFWGLIASMWIGNAMLLILNLPLVGLWARLIAVPYRVLVPAILTFCCIGLYAADANAYQLFSLAGFTVIGYALVKLGCEPAPLLLGFILGPMLEENFRRAMLISLGDPLVFVQRPISAGLLAVAVLIAVILAAPALRTRRERVFGGSGT